MATAVLYSFSYAVKMSYNGKDVPQGYFGYTVFPMEGVWDLADKSKSIEDKSNYKCALMIRQPAFLTKALFNRFLEETKRKKPNDFLNMIVMDTIDEGLCCQMLHIGSYDDEPASFERMIQFCKDKDIE